MVAGWSIGNLGVRITLGIYIIRIFHITVANLLVLDAIYSKPGSDGVVIIGVLIYWTGHSNFLSFNIHYIFPKGMRECPGRINFPSLRAELRFFNRLPI